MAAAVAGHGEVTEHTIAAAGDSLCPAGSRPIVDGVGRRGAIAANPLAPSVGPRHGGRMRTPPRWFALLLSLACLVLFAVVGSGRLSAQPADSPERILQRSPGIALGTVGRGGGLSEEAKALRALVRQSGAAARLEALFRHGGPMAQAYALAGLKYAGSPRYRALARRAASRPGQLRMITGDVVRRVSWREFVQRLEQDYPTLP